MDIVKITGGARIGVTNITWPFVVLTVTKDRLVLNASIVGNFSFMPFDIVSIEPYSGIIGKGIKINHRVETYKKKIVFWSLNKSNEIIDLISQTGFLNHTSASYNQVIKNEIIEKQKQGSFPIKPPIVIAVIVIWIILFLIDIVGFVGNLLHNEKNEGMPLKIGAAMAFGFMLFISILTFISRRFRKSILKKDRDITDVSRLLSFLILLSIFMLCFILFFLKRQL